jgi:hypothetical protein
MFVARKKAASLFVFSETIGIPEAQLEDVAGLIFVRKK